VESFKIKTKKLTAKGREKRQTERFVEETKNSLMKSNNDTHISRYAKYGLNNV
jgi:hypothetical protein